MTDLKFVEPGHIPSEFLVYDKKVDQLDVGKTGKVGYLRIKLEKDSKKKRTATCKQGTMCKSEGSLTGGAHVRAF